MSLDSKIKNQLLKLKKSGKIEKFKFDENLTNIMMKNSDGVWEFKQDNLDYCDNCGEKSQYLLVLSGFAQCYQCKNCILYSLEHYDESGWEDPKLPDVK